MLSCQKKVEPIDAYKVVVEYKATNAFAVTQSKEVNPKDSIFFDFTVSGPQPIAFIEIQKNGVRIDTFRVEAGKTSFAGSKGYRADSIPGDYTYRVLARDAQATFMGDGGKQFKITVKPDFDFWSYRIVAVPDTTAKTNKCYYSTRDGMIYNYNEAGAKSATIDFGYYFDTTGMGTTATTDDLGHTFYALNANQSQLGFYDVSGFTKNATIFKKLPSSVNFVSGLTSAGAINTLVRGNMASGNTSSVNRIATSAGNNVIGFRTADGKYGAILVRFIRGNSPARTTQLEVDVKVQK
ncbi:MAG TPA: hypothetical protein PKD90_03355 [Phnomibacter sp.]|nr:hypothetical protein [Phnomibacter sp.]